MLFIMQELCRGVDAAGTAPWEVIQCARLENTTKQCMQGVLSEVHAVVGVIGSHK